MKELSGLELPPFRLIHIAYVTDDLESANASLSSTFGLDKAQIVRDTEIAIPGSSARIDFIVGDAHGTAMEAIMPIGGADTVYRDGVSKASDVRFHHFASRVESQDEWELLLSTIKKRNLEVVVDGDVSGTKYLYIDTRKHLGHYIEYIWNYDDSVV